MHASDPNSSPNTLPSSPRPTTEATKKLNDLELELKKSELELRRLEITEKSRPWKSAQVWSSTTTALLGLLIGSFVTFKQSEQDLRNIETRLQVAEFKRDELERQRDNLSKELADTSESILKLTTEYATLQAKVDLARKSAADAKAFERDCIDHLKDSILISGRLRLGSFEQIFEKNAKALRDTPINELSTSQQELLMIDLYRKNESERLVELSDQVNEGLTAIFALRLAADLQWQRTSYEKAEKTIRRAIKRFPASHQAYKTLAVILSSQGRNNEALAAIEIAISIKERADYLYTRGTILRKLKMIGKATDALLGALTLKGDLVDAYLELGQIYEERGQHDKAFELLQDGLEKAPFDPRLNNNLSWICYLKKDYKQAEELAWRAIRHMPLSGASYHTLGLIYYEKGRYGTALQFLEKAAMLSPENTRIAEDLKMVRSATTNDSVTQSP